MNSQREKKYKTNMSEKVLKDLEVKFGPTLDIEIIRAVASECDFNIQRASDVLTEMTANVDKNFITGKNKRTPTSTSTSSLNLDSLKTNKKDIIETILKGYKVLILLRGVPGCGKSYLAHQITNIVLGNGNNNHHILSTDDFFMQQGYYKFDPRRLQEAHELNQRKAFHQMSRGLSPVIIDNTNIEMWEMKPYATMGTDFGYIIEILEPNTWWSFNEKELFRKNKHNIPQLKIREMLQRYDHNINTHKLLTDYNLVYKFNKPPQFRLLPPLTNPEKNKTFNSASGMRKSTSSTMELGSKASTVELLPLNDFYKNENLIDFQEDSAQKQNICVKNFNSNCLTSVDDMLSYSETDNYTLSKPKPTDTLNNTKANFENIENAWGVDAKFFESWDFVTPLQFDKLNENTNLLTKKEDCPIVTKNNSTCFELDDLMATKKSFDSNKYKIVDAIGRNINEGNTNISYSISQKTVFDKSCLTEKMFRKDDKLQLQDLSDLFPKIPPSYINDLYNKCNQNFDWVVDLLLEDNNKSALLSFDDQEYKETFKGTKSEKALNITSNPSTSNYVENIDSDDSSCEDDEVTNMLEINLGEKLVSELEKYFCSDDAFPKGFQPVVQMPALLARQIYTLYIESICDQMDAQNNILERLTNEDEEFARNLQSEEDDINKSTNAVLQEANYNDNAYTFTANSLATKLTQDKLMQMFPLVEKSALLDVYYSHNNNYNKTVEDLVASVGSPILNNDEIDQQPIPDDLLQEMKDDETNISIDEEEEKPAVYYREIANKHLQRRSELYEKAKSYQQRKMTEVALFYSSLAKKETLLFDKANNFAAATFADEHTRRLQKFDTIDLHYLYVKEAITYLDVVIDKNINLLADGPKSVQTLFIITGKGKHSLGGKSKIKPAVIQRLKKRNITFVHVNAGFLKIRVCRDSLTTTALLNS